jgi:hypothetical protein
LEQESEQYMQDEELSQLHAGDDLRSSAFEPE